MISIFSDIPPHGERLSVKWNDIEFNQPTLSRTSGVHTGARLESVGYNTPINFSSETIDDMVRGGGIEWYNPIVGTRVLNLRGSLRANSEADLMKQIVEMQEAFHPLALQMQYAGAWPPPTGEPAWVESKPLTFTRVVPKSEIVPNGRLLLQYHVVPISLPDPVRASVQQGVGVDYEAQFIIMRGGRSFLQTPTTRNGDGTIAMPWGKAPVWPIITVTMSGSGNAALTCTVSGGPTATALVLNASGLSNNDVLKVDTAKRIITLNGVAAHGRYVSGNYPVFYGPDQSVAWTNTGGTTSRVITYRESGYV